MFRRYLKALVSAALMTTALSACSGGSPLPTDKASANISGYNHTEDYIHEFYVDGAWGGNVFAYGGGGSFVCCIAYPRQWREGLTAKVRWTTSSSDPEATGDAIKGKWHEVVVPIERYTMPGTTLNVHFLPGGLVRLIVTSGSSDQPGYPGPPSPIKPKDFKW
jgi:Protein of unknown function (DUF3304)